MKTRELSPSPLYQKRHAQRRVLAPSALAVALAIALSGCAVGPDFIRPTAATPAHWSGFHAAPPDRRPPAGKQHD